MKASSAKKSGWRAAFPPAEEKRAVRHCDHPGCAEEGEFRAPQARDRLNEYYWFCLDHVREYNAAWNYYAGMSADEIEMEVRHDTTWQRPTWPLGAKGASRRFNFTIHDPFELYETESAEEQRHRVRPLTPEEEAMKVLGLDGPLTMGALKARYKELVKRHHPDANGGDKDAEERFKAVNQAYHTLRASLSA